MVRTKTLVHSNPEIMSGEPVFMGTRVPVQSLFDWLEGGDSLDYWLSNFPSVSRDQAIAVLRMARESVIASAYSA